jgi:hypothetical protein
MGTSMGSTLEDGERLVSSIWLMYFCSASWSDVQGRKKSYLLGCKERWNNENALAGFRSSFLVHFTNTKPSLQLISRNDWIAMGEKRNSYIPSRPEEYYGRLGQWTSWVRE